MIIEREEQVTDAVLGETQRIEDSRTKQIIQALIRHLHGFAREVRLTEQEFNQAINQVAALGRLTTDSHNEVRLISGSLGLSTLVCMMNNAGTSAGLLGPFWRKEAPFVENGGSIVRSPTPGPALYFTGKVIDTEGRPVAGANVDVWHASTRGLYENQDPEQADWNLRGRLITDAEGTFRYRTIKPAGYPVPAGGPTEKLLEVQHRHPFRPAHLHSLIYKEGFKTIANQVYGDDSEILESDAQFGVLANAVAHYVSHENEPAPDRDVTGTWYSMEHTFVLQRGDSWLPTPPVSAKSQTAATMMAAAQPAPASAPLTASGMEARIRTYFEDCNSGDIERIAAHFEPEAVHYFPPGMYEGPFRGARTIAQKWNAAVKNLGSVWTIDQMLCDAPTRRAVIEWTHFKRASGVMLRGDEWYIFSPRGLIQEIRAYYASPQDATLKQLELAGFDYAGRGYPTKAP